MSDKDSNFGLGGIVNSTPIEKQALITSESIVKKIDWEELKRILETENQDGCLRIMTQTQFDEIVEWELQQRRKED